jgi:hypothetical protein
MSFICFIKSNRSLKLPAEPSSFKLFVSATLRAKLSSPLLPVFAQSSADFNESDIASFNKSF